MGRGNRSAKISTKDRPRKVKAAPREGRINKRAEGHFLEKRKRKTEENIYWLQKP